VGSHRYSLTFCTHNRKPLLTDARAVDIVMNQFLRTSSDEGFAIIAYCAMPDHVHLLVEGTRDDSDAKRFISRGKQSSGFLFAQERGTRLWQRYGYEHVLRDEEATPLVVRYILENPVRAGLVDNVRAYPYIGSSVYSRDELIEYAYRDNAGSG
jgi:putative transposase